MFRGQQDDAKLHVGFYPERDFIKRKICEGDDLRKQFVVVAVRAGERRDVIGPDGECPSLERFSLDLFDALVKSDFIKEPIRPSGFCDVLRAIGVNDGRIEQMAIPFGGAGELQKTFFG